MTDDDDDFGEDGAFVHALVARVRAEHAGAEPSELLTARLMAAAKKEVKRGGGWARIAAHPALAAAAMVVIIAGATAIWMKNGGKVAEPSRRESAPAWRAPVSGGASGSGSASGISAGSGSAPGISAGSGSASAAAAVTPPTDTTVAPPTAHTSPPLQRDNQRKGHIGGADKTETHAEDTPPAPPPPPPPQIEKPKPETKETVEKEPAGNTDTINGTVLGGEGQAPMPEPDDETTTVQTQDVDGAKLAEQYTKQARGAAKKGQCSVVTMLGDKVKKIDVGYYTNNFANDPDIKRCH